MMMMIVLSRLLTSELALNINATFLLFDDEELQDNSCIFVKLQESSKFLVLSLRTSKEQQLTINQSPILFSQKDSDLPRHEVLRLAQIR